jgi:hypothetical protein
MRIWSLQHPRDPAFAEASLVGERSYCKGKRIQPLVIEWDPGSDVIGDFTWTLIATGIAVTERVGKMLLERFRGFELGPVEMIQNPRLKRPARITRRTKPRVWLPYEGPPLYELWVTAWVNADVDRSTVTIERNPSTGITTYHLTGDERTEIRVDGQTGMSVRTRVPREPGKGLYVPEQEVEDVDIFRLVQRPGCVSCTDAVRDFILANEFTNVDFFEIGETF